MEKLTEKQKRFVDFYIQTGNASEAARLAGYSKKISSSIGSENLRKPEIKNAIDARLKEFESSRKADTKEILEYMTSVMRGELEEEVVSAVGTGDGHFEPKIIIKRVGIKERNKAAEMLAKIHGMFNEKAEVKVDAAQILIDTLSSVWERQDE